MSANSQNIEAIYPLTPLQQGLLFHALYEPRSEAYFVQFGYRLRGELDVAAFKRAWEQMLERHQILRTLFVWERQEKTFQVVRRQVRLPWQEEDWRGCAPEEQESRLRRFLDRDRARGFDLSRAPLMRLTLIRLADDVHQFILDFHHLLLDGWSVGLVLKEVFSLYAAYRSGEEPALARPRPFRDYVLWLGRQDAGRAERYWRSRLSGLTRPTPLPAASSGTKESRYEERRVSLGAELSAALREAARQHRLTLNTVAQGAWALLLSRYGGTRDVLFGAVVSGRPAELEGAGEMVGLFINTLPVRVKVEEGAGVWEWLRGLQREQVEMREYEYSPLSQVQRWSELPPSTPLFESLYLFENYSVEPLARESVGGLRVEMSHSTSKTTYPLNFIVNARDELSLYVGYDDSRYDGETIGRLLGHYETLLRGMAEGPERAVRSLPLLGAEERRRLLKEWNETSAEYPSHLCVHKLFEAQAARTPDEVAVSQRGVRLTYRELDARANRLAHRLRSLGVGAESLVGLLTHRSIEMVVGLLGILKAGGAYVPLDPSHPAERLALLLEDLPFLVSERRLAEGVRAGTTRTVYLEEDADGPGSDRPPEVGVRPENLAYVIYTSGSTGRPKGVMVTHRGVVNYLSWCAREYRVGEGQGSAVHSPLGFDLTVTSLLAPLVAGRRVELLPEEQGVEELAAALHGGNDYSLIKLTPSHLEALGYLLRSSEVADSTRALVIGGEALSAQSLAFWRRAAPHVRLINEYGPTETVVGCCVYEVSADDPQAGPVPIGRPVANTQLYVLDPEGRPVPVGVAGELYIGGSGVARGYLNSPALTAERFIPDPFGDTAGARLYKTGDLARYLHDGNLVYLGRLDDQVKVRGFRIELGEVEAALCQHPSIREAAVLPRENRPGQTYLVAYVVPEREDAGAQTPSPTSLREYLKGKLPEYMVPAAFVLLDSLPLTSNGKLDRRALPAPESAQEASSAGRYVEPRTEAERVLAEVWAQVLGRERVGVEENFFELGGDSILSIQVVARAGRSGLRLTPRLLFEHPTVAGLAAAAATPDGVSHAGGGGQSAEDDEAGGEVALTPVQHWFFSRALRRPHHFNQSSLLRLRPGADPELLRRALQHLLDYHGALRLRFTHDAQGWRSRYAPEEALSWRELDLSHVADAAERRRAIEAEASATQAGLNLESGPLLRAVYFDCGAEESARLLVVIHHLAVDGVSWRVLLDDLERAYGQLAAGQSIELGPKTTSYRRWSEALVALADSEEMREELEYWAAQPWASAARLSEAGRGGDNGDSGSGAVEAGERLAAAHRLTEEETEALLREAPGAYRARVEELLLAALGRALGRYAGAGEVVVELEGHGREELGAGREGAGAGLDLSRTVGWFTSLYPVLLRMDAGEGFGEALRRVKGRLRGVPRRGLGYGVLKYLSQDEGVRRRMSDIPEASVVFNYLGQFGAKMGAGGVLIEGGAEEGAGATQWEGEACDRKVTVNSAVVGGRLEVRWGYGAGARWAEGAAAAYVEELRGLAGRRKGAGAEALAATALTASDFPLAKLDDEKLGRLGAALRRRAEKRNA